MTEQKLYTLAAPIHAARITKVERADMGEGEEILTLDDGTELAYPPDRLASKTMGARPGMWLVAGRFSVPEEVFANVFRSAESPEDPGALPGASERPGRGRRRAANDGD